MKICNKCKSGSLQVTYITQYAIFYLCKKCGHSWWEGFDDGK